MSQPIVTVTAVTADSITVSAPFTTGTVHSDTNLNLSLVYNTNGQLSNINRADGHSTSLQYDAAGSLQQITTTTNTGISITRSLAYTSSGQLSALDYTN